MTGRTHDLAAFTALTYIIILHPLSHVSYATLIVAFGANMIGGLTPDIDQPTGDLWHKLPAGTVFSRLFTPLLGGHRYISHSILGIILFGLIAKFLLQLSSHALLVDNTLVWWSFMIGYISHLFMDTLTKEGVPWFFPIPIRLGIPPLRFMRIKTGGMIEKGIIFPLLIGITFYLFYTNQAVFLSFFHHGVK